MEQVEDLLIYESNSPASPAKNRIPLGNIQNKCRRGPNQRKLLENQVQNQVKFHENTASYYEKLLEIKTAKLQEIKEIRRLMEEDIKSKTIYRMEKLKL